MSRVAVIGLDCVPPALVFGRFRGQLPHLAGLMERGAWGALRSCFPPITVPAWACMVSGRDPGELGLYGFRDRVPASYALRTVDARDLRVPRIWDALGARGRHVSAVAVPPSYPVAPLAGEQVGCFLTPSAESAHTYPPHLAGQLRARFGPYRPDASDPRGADKAALLQDLMDGTRQRFQIARYLWEEREPDFLMLVDISPDRLHHAFWPDFDPAHPRHVPGGPFEDAALRYYRHLDAQLGELLHALGPDTNVIVASDHGARPLQGAFRINEWLIDRGWLVLRARPGVAQPLRPAHVDFARTRAWAEGGYYARVFLNRRGRDPEGCVAPEDYAALRAALQQELSEVCGLGGAAWRNRVHTPQELYREVRGAPPDLLAVFDDLNVRPISSVGGAPGHYAEGDDRGPDGCNHDWDGVFLCAGPDVRARGPLRGLALHDVAATAFGVLGEPQPEGWLGVDRVSATTARVDP